MNYQINFQFGLPIIKVLFVVFSLLFFAVTYWLYGESKNFLDHSYRSLGVVVSILPQEHLDENNKRYTLHASKIAYKRNDGSIGFYLCDYRYYPRFEIDEEVVVRVDRNDPKNVKLERIMDIWGGVVVFGGFALLLLCIGLFLIIVNPKLVSREVSEWDDGTENE